MALTLNDFVGFETQGLEEVDSTEGSPAVNTDAPVHSGLSSLKIIGTATRARTFIAPFLKTARAGNDDIVGFWFRTNDTTPTNNTDFHTAEVQDSQNAYSLRLKTTGNVVVLDGGGTEVGTEATTPFTVDTWHFVEVFWHQGTANNDGTIDVHVDGSSIISETGLDFLGDSATWDDVLSEYQFTGNTTVGEDFYYDDVYMMSGASGTGDFLGDAEVFNYQNTVEDATDIGDTLADGTWALVGETPLNEGTSNDAQYIDTGNLTGSTICDEGSRAGPTGDANVDGTIKGAKWVGRFKRGSGGERTFGFLVGNSGDGVTSKAITLTTAYVTKMEVSEAAGEVPLSTESFQHGFSKSATAGQDIFCGEIWAMLLHVPSAAGGVVVDRTPTDTLAVSDVKMYLLAKNVAENHDPIVDDFFKLLVKRIAEDQDSITDTDLESLVRNQLLTDTQNISDAFARTLFKMFSDNEDISDVELKVLLKLLADNEDVSDAFSKLLAKLVTDRQDVSDESLLTLLRQLLLQDSQDITDAFARTLFKLLADDKDVSDLFTKLLQKVIADDQDIEDTALTQRHAQLSFSDTQDVVDAVSKALTKTLADTEDTSDVFTRALTKVIGDTEDMSDVDFKTLIKVLAEAQDPIVDTLNAFKSIVLRILEDQDVRDAFSLALFKTLTDEQRGEDVLVKELRKLISEDQDPIVDSVATQKLRAVILQEIIEVQDIRDAFSLILT